MFGLRKNNKPQEISLTISNQTFFRVALLIVGTLFFLLFLQKAANALLLIFIAFFFAIALNAPVHWLAEHLPKRFKYNRSLATSLSFLVIVILLGAFLASLVPPLVKQTSTFVSAAPSLIDDFRNQDSALGKAIRRYNLQDEVKTISTQLSSKLNNAGGTAFSTFKSVSSSVFSLLTILVLTFMMLVEGSKWLKIGRELIPDNKHDMASRVVSEMYGVVKGFVNGQVILAALAAILILPAILALNIGYPAALVVVVFICGLIPMVGHTIGAIIVTIVALFESTSSAAIILAYYFLYQQVENYVVQPRIQANSTNMSPLLVFISVVIGVSFGGLIGALLAIPVGGCLRIATLEYLRQRKILDSAELETSTNGTR